jgi:hypothetical protein
MTIGAVVVALFWLIVAGLILRPAGVAAPLLWVAVFLAALLAWLQALTWFPFPLPFLRIVVAVLLLGALATGAMLGQTYQVSATLLLTASAGLIPLGYLVAVVGVARARRGDTPVWAWPAVWGSRSALPPPFASADQAMFWLEWRRHGFVLPLLVSLLLGPQMLLVFFTHGPRAAGLALTGLVTNPLLLALLAGARLGNCHPWSRKASGLPAFLAARPITAATMVAVKLRVAFRITLVTWGIIAVVTLAVLPFSTAGAASLRWIQQWLDVEGLRGYVLLVLIVLALPALTWKIIVNQLWCHLAGRNWISLTMSLAIPIGITALSIFIGWLTTHPEARDVLLAVVPWVVGGLLLLKLGLGAWVGWALLHRGVVAPRTLRNFAIGWTVGAAALIGLAFWLMPPDTYSPLLVGCAAILLALPLVRLGLAPLALDWNRHR